MDERQEIKSLKKALRALAFLNVNGESTVTEVACAIGVPRTTSYRLLETFASEGYVEKQPHSDVYRLTSMVQRLASGFGDTDLVVEVASPLIYKIGAEIGWPLALATPRGKNMVVRASTDHDTSLAIDRYMIGFATPILHAPAGYCYLAHCPDSVRDAIIEMTEQTDAGFDALWTIENHLDYLLGKVRAQGYSHIRFAEYREAGLAVPLLINGHAVGGIVMRYIKSTIKAGELEEKFVPILRQLSQEIETAYEVQSSQRRLKAEDTNVHIFSAQNGVRRRRTQALHS